jgi:hypothetical protein
MNLNSLLRTSARYLATVSAGVILSSTLAPSTQAMAGGINEPTPPMPIPTFHPYIDGINDGFAYKVIASATRQDVYLAQMIAVTPSPLAEVTKLMQSYVSDGAGTVTVNRMKASLNNDRLIVQYTIQGSDFVDSDVDFFDMQTGAFQGFINEQAFATFNSSIQPSQRLAELKADWVQKGYVTAAQAAGFDYSINPDDYGVFSLSTRWNMDGTATIMFQTTVFLANAPGFNGTPIGTETFYINMAYSSVTNKMEIADYNISHIPALYPPLFTFSIQNGAVSGKMLFQNTPILFHTVSRRAGSGGIGGIIFADVYATANAMEAAIPSVYYWY